MTTLRAALRQSLAHALARRAGQHGGEAQRRLQARLAAWDAPAEPPPADAPPPPRPASPLAALLAEHAQRPRTAAPLASAPTAAALPGRGEPEALAWFRDTWSRLDTPQRLAASQAGLPGNAGPLNAQHLAHRALVVMNEASPDCLRHFVTQLDTLWWLDAVHRAEPVARPTAGKALDP